MKNTFRITAALAAALLLGGIASAQTPATTNNNEGQASNPGIVNITAIVNNSADLRSGGPVTVSGTDVLVNSNVAANDALNVGFTFRDASTNTANGNNMLSAIVPIRLRSNAPYSVYAYNLDQTSTGAVQNGGGNNTFGDGDFRVGDIGFGIGGANASGSNLTRSGSLAASGTDTVGTGAIGSQDSNLTGSNKFYDPRNISMTADGQPKYDGTLDMIGDNAAAAQIILSGDRISLGGDNRSTANDLPVDLVFTVKPQYYTPTTGKTASVRLFIVAP